MAMPCASASAGPVGRERRAVEGASRRRRPMHAEDQIAQRRLAGAVLAQQAVHLARADVERDVLQRRQAAEALRIADSDSSGSAVSVALELAASALLIERV